MTHRANLRVLNNSRSMYSLFSDFLPPTQVVVIPDSRYQELQQERAQRELTIIESKINRYERLVSDLREEADNIKKQVGVLEPAAETE